MKKHFATLNGIKRAAIKLKRRTGVRHNEALNQIAREAGFKDYHAAIVAYAAATEVPGYLTAKASGINLAGLARRLAALPAPFSEHDGPGEDEREIEAPLPPVEVIEMPPELAAALKHQRDLDIAEAGPQAPELSGLYRGVDVSSRWDIGHELRTMRKIVDAMPDYVRERVSSIWCDSNAQADYWVQAAPGRWFDGIEYEIRDAIRSATSGFNGLLVEGDRHNKHFDPEWEGDDDDYAEEASWGPVEVDVEDL